MWVLHESFQQVVQVAWGSAESNHPIFNVLLKLKNVKRALRSWNKETFGNIFEQVKQVEHSADIESKLQVTDISVDLDSNLYNQFSVATNNLRKLKLIMEEIYWKQKARISWLEEGDRNTRFFHASAIERQRKAAIKSIELDSGHRLEEISEIKEVASEFFQVVFKAENSSLDPALLDVIPNLISPEMNDRLLSPPSLLKVKQVVLAISIDVAPGSNSFPGSFFASCWDVIGNDLLKAATFLFQGGNLPRAISTTLIYLALKSTTPKKFLDFRPISLCNCLYKILVKIISVRLSEVLPSLISLEQGAFVQGRSMVESIALAQEMARELNRKVRGGNIVLKLDMEKAYDRLD
ncbi:uncharacterized protein LOC131255311 [Magnolia sinica]|uniref:uncharacterized protein LOC131255311 n=1 Tax=Magnolia sinica TaxID=86752 RepID=UPI0026594D62|nr:uncharacterized protein LOC131255311 [Magnolia sinica]